jgi:hypothetical protein
LKISNSRAFSNKKLVYPKTSPYSAIIYSFPNYVQCFFVHQPGAGKDGNEDPREQKPGRRPQIFVEKTAYQRENHNWNSNGIAEIPGKGKGGKRFIIFLGHGIFESKKAK